MGKMVSGYFKNIKDIIKGELAKAEKSVYVISAYFTDKDLFNMLCELGNRGIKVELITLDFENHLLDKELLIDSGGVYYKASKIDDSLIHHKFCVIDKRVVITGSYNWTNKAQSNKENIIIAYNKSLANKFLEEFYDIKNILEKRNKMKVDNIFDGYLIKTEEEKNNTIIYTLKSRLDGSNIPF